MSVMIRRARRGIFAIYLRARKELPCGCHWQEPYGPVVMMGCPRHD